jgi:hypothetical protein
LPWAARRGRPQQQRADAEAAGIRVRRAVEPCLPGPGLGRQARLPVRQLGGAGQQLGRAALRVILFQLCPRREQRVQARQARLRNIRLHHLRHSRHPRLCRRLRHVNRAPPMAGRRRRLHQDAQQRLRFVQARAGGQAACRHAFIVECSVG